LPKVRVRRLRFAIALLGVTLVGVALGGCSVDVSQFSATDLNPFKGNDPFRASDYNYFYRGDASTSGPVTAADLVGPDGRCAYAPAPPPMMAPGAPPADAPVAAAPTTDPINPQSNGALYFTAGPQSGPPAGGPAGAMPPEVRNGPRGISLAMTECQVMSVAGNTDRVEIGANTRGERTVTLTYLSGDRPGIYHFRGGRLMSMERVAEPPAPPKPKKPVKTAKVVKKKQQPQ
jgi:hypothetical protein